jgi:hypothetical protein
MQKVRVNSLYYYDPCGFDVFNPTSNNCLTRGDQVRVINLHGCPPANTMGQCYVVPANAVKDSRGNWDKDFTMVSVGSLHKDKPTAIIEQE